MGCQCKEKNRKSSPIEHYIDQDQDCLHNLNVFKLGIVSCNVYLCSKEVEELLYLYLIRPEMKINKKT